MATQTTIKKLPMIKEDTVSLKLRIQELEREVSNYRNRLDELRKAKNNLIIKKTTEYVKTELPALGQRREKNKTPEEEQPVEQTLDTNANLEYIQELVRKVDSLTVDLTESKNLIAALRIENEEVKSLLEKTKKDSQVELAEAYTKNEEYKKEIKQWEVMYKEWMTMMEDRVSNINRTHEMLQKCIKKTGPGSDSEPEPPIEKK